MGYFNPGRDCGSSPSTLIIVCSPHSGMSQGCWARPMATTISVRTREESPTLVTSTTRRWIAAMITSTWTAGGISERSRLHDVYAKASCGNEAYRTTAHQQDSVNIKKQVRIEDLQLMSNRDFSPLVATRQPLEVSSN
jgi:hypothetical protein